MKREQCPRCGVGRVRKRTSRPYGSLELWYLGCSKNCGYSERLKVKPAEIISKVRFDSTTDAPSTTRKKTRESKHANDKKQKRSAG